MDPPAVFRCDEYICSLELVAAKAANAANAANNTLVAEGQIPEDDYSTPGEGDYYLLRLQNQN